MHRNDFSCLGPCGSLVSLLLFIHPPSSFLCQKSTPYKERVVFYKPVHALRGRDGPPGPNHDSFTAKPCSHHVHVTLQATSRTSPCPTFSADPEPAHKRVKTIFSVRCNQKCTIHDYMASNRLHAVLSCIQFIGAKLRTLTVKPPRKAQ